MADEKIVALADGLIAEVRGFIERRPGSHPAAARRALLDAISAALAAAREAAVGEERERCVALVFEARDAWVAQSASFADSYDGGGWAAANTVVEAMVKLARALRTRPAPGEGESDAEAIARRFHEAYERLAPLFGYATRKASAVPWEQVPEANRKLMIATCAEVFGVAPPARREAGEGGGER